MLQQGFSHSKWRGRLLQISSEVSKFPGYSAEMITQDNHYCWDRHFEQFAGLAVTNKTLGKTFEFILSLRCPLCNYALLSLDLQYMNGEMPKLSDQSSLQSGETMKFVFHAVGVLDLEVGWDESIKASVLNAGNLVCAISQIVDKSLKPDQNSE